MRISFRIYLATVSIWDHDSAKMGYRILMTELPKVDITAGVAAEASYMREVIYSYIFLVHCPLLNS